MFWKNSKAYAKFDYPQKWDNGKVEQRSNILKNFMNSILYAIPNFIDIMWSIFGYSTIQLAPRKKFGDPDGHSTDPVPMPIILLHTQIISIQFLYQQQILEKLEFPIILLCINPVHAKPGLSLVQYQHVWLFTRPFRKNVGFIRKKHFSYKHWISAVFPDII